MDDRRLKANERRQLLAILRRPRNARQYRHRRALAVVESEDGKTVAEIAEMLRVSRQSVYNWIEDVWRTRSVHQLTDAPRSGQPPSWGFDDRMPRI